MVRSRGSRSQPDVPHALLAGNSGGDERLEGVKATARAPEIGKFGLPVAVTARNSITEQFAPAYSSSPNLAIPPDSAVLRYDRRLARQSSFREAIDDPSLHDGGRLFRLLLGVIAEHV